MSFGKLGAMGRGFGHLGALGTGQGATLEAPVLAMDPAWTSADSTPDFLLSWVSFNVLTDDVITIQVQADGGSWSSFEINNDHTVTAGEEAAGYVALGLSALTNGDHEARAKVTRGTAFSNWSNTVSFTVAAVSDREWVAGSDYIYSSATRTYAAQDSYIVEVTN